MNNKKKKALILGITGMDGSHLADVLLAKGYEVHGMRRRTATSNTRNIQHILDSVKLHFGDMKDYNSLFNIIKEVRPDEIYNEADQDHAGLSWKMPKEATNITAGAVGDLLEIIREINPSIKFFQPLTAHMFGVATESPQNENTALRPESPYSCAKAYAFHLCKMYRNAYGMKIYTAILYNHTSYRQSEEYILPKIVKSAMRIKNGTQEFIELGDLDAKIDIGWAAEYMEAAQAIMQGEPDDYVVGRGKTHSIKEIIDETFKILEIKGDNLIRINKDFLRPANPKYLIADTTKIQSKVGWMARVNLEGIIQAIIKNE